MNKLFAYILIIPLLIAFSASSLSFSPLKRNVISSGYSSLDAKETIGMDVIAVHTDNNTAKERLILSLKFFIYLSPLHSRLLRNRNSSNLHHLPTHYQSTSITPMHFGKFAFYSFQPTQSRLAMWNAGDILHGRRR